MAPAWMTMVYIFQYASSSGILISASAMRRCAVELTGKNSVKPSTMPNKNGLNVRVQKASGVKSASVPSDVITG